MNSNILSSIKSGTNFIFEAGPGSGKTTSLIQTLRKILDEPGGIINTQRQKIACITYTNVAANEITERLQNNSTTVHVSTIHSFLWNQIGHYQSELREIIRNINADRENPKKYVPNLDLDEVEIKYIDGYADLSKGEISHDDLLEISFHMYENHSPLRHLTKCRYPIIFLDEYQDTQPRVIEILQCLLESEPKDPTEPSKFSVGLFGDSMQSIYNDGIGFVSPKTLNAATITKEENFRSTNEIVTLINTVRARSSEATPVIQVAKRTDLPDESMCSLYYTSADTPLTSSMFNHIASRFGWTLGEDTKILELTHSAISRTGNWSNFQKAVSKRGRDILDNLRKGDDTYSSTFFFVTSLYRAWSSGDGFTALNTLRFQSPDSHKERTLFSSVDEMLHWSSLLDEFVTRCKSDNLQVSSISSILSFVWDNEICSKAARITQYEDRTDFNKETHKQKRDEFLNALTLIPFRELLNFYDYLNDTSPFCTEHSTKGAEFDNVILIIDNSTWKQQYKVSTLFGSSDHIDERIERTLKLFYVAISRARNNLIVVYKNPTPDSIAGAKELFGEDNVQPLEEVLPNIATY
jgi:DNA helicase II